MGTQVRILVPQPLYSFLFQYVRPEKFYKNPVQSLCKGKVPTGFISLKSSKNGHQTVTNHAVSIPTRLISLSVGQITQFSHSIFTTLSPSRSHRKSHHLFRQNYHQGGKEIQLCQCSNWAVKSGHAFFLKSTKRHFGKECLLSVGNTQWPFCS